MNPKTDKIDVREIVRDEIIENVKYMLDSMKGYYDAKKGAGGLPPMTAEAALESSKEHSLIMGTLKRRHKRLMRLYESELVGETTTVRELISKLTFM